MKIEVKEETQTYNNEKYKLLINEELVFKTNNVDKLAEKAAEYVKLRFSQ